MLWLDWYNSLDKPSWTPALATIGLIWQILYPHIAVTFGLVYIQADSRRTRDHEDEYDNWRKYSQEFGISNLQRAKQIAQLHHEWWDGTGYPEMLRGMSIPPSARIVAIVDVYDVLSHDRVYRPALPDDKVLWHLHQGRARQFDPELLDIFFDRDSRSCNLRAGIHLGARYSAKSNF